MTFNVNCRDQYQLKWLRVLYCLRGLGFESYVCQLCDILFLCIILRLGMNVSSDNVILKL